MPKHIIILSFNGGLLPVGTRAQSEGFKVTVGLVQKADDLGIGKKETPEEQKSRLSLYAGMDLNIVPINTLMKQLLAADDKSDYFVLPEMNYMFSYTEQLAAAGFTKGMFPTEQDYEFEKDRKAAMDFVKQHYPELVIIPFQEFSSADEVIKFLEDADKPYVLQSDGDFVATVVPTKIDPEKSSAQLIAQLNKNKALYDKGKIILKEMLIDPVEITPQTVFYDGEPVYSSMDVEMKTLGDGQANGNMVGSSCEVNMATDMLAPINRIAFPPVVQRMAKRHKGIFIWDASIYVMPDGKKYFGEFCSCRFGYSTIFSEIAMSGSVRDYFENIMYRVNPLLSQYGASITLFNLNRQEGSAMSWEDGYVWPWDVQKVGGEVVSVGESWDLGVVSASGDTPEEAISRMFDTLHGVSFKEVYTRTQQDMLSSYPTSIMHRLDAVRDLL